MPRKKVTTTTTVVTEELDTTPRKTLVNFLLDRTGSMQRIKGDTIGGFNAYLDALEREAGDLVEFTFLTFDSISTDKICVGAALKNVARLTDGTYVPRANTPLVDAFVKLIKATEEQVAKRTDSPRVIVVAQTDGEENCSHEYTTADLTALIKRKTADGWEFVFMGANIDAYQAGHRFGVSVGSTVSYDSTRSASAFQGLAQNTAAFAMGTSASMGYSNSQKFAAGDTFVPRPQPTAAAVLPKRPKRRPPVADDITL